MLRFTRPKNIKIINKNTRQEYACTKVNVDEKIPAGTDDAVDENIDSDKTILTAQKRNLNA